jgi:hypothetical protein
LTVDGAPAGCHAQQMFARRDLRLALSFEAGRARLVNLVSDGALAGASHAAYEAGIAVIRVGPLGNVPGAGKLVRVSFLDPSDHDGVLRVGLRWEATGIAGDLFPVLDGDLTLTPAEAGTARLALAGVYRPPLGRLGARLDAAVLHKVADSTFSAFLHSVSGTMASPAPAPGAPAWEPGAAGTTS